MTRGGEGGRGGGGGKDPYIRWATGDSSQAVKL